jgi:hypothetical protein
MRNVLTVVFAGLLLAIAACSKSGNTEDKILPVHANISVDAVTATPAIFFQTSASNTGQNDVVAVDIMLRPSGSVSFSAIDMEVKFDPGLVQIGQIDTSASPLGDCQTTTTCAPICSNNVNPSSASTPKANDVGDLILGIATNGLCPGVTVSTTTHLLTLWFIATTVGTSQITLVDTASTGDCEILSGSPPVPLPITCYSGNATIVAAR